MTNNTRRSIDLLPAFFRTEKNNKFLSSTLDQLISPPQLNRVDGFVGSKNTPNYQEGDQYLEESTGIRQEYQLEPALVVKTLNQEIKKAFAIDDLLNQVNNHQGSSYNLDRTLSPKFYSYDPKIDWDKFVNFRKYYWLPLGPETVVIAGDKKAVQTEFTVSDADDGIQFFFDNKTTTPQLTLYRGTTYVFNVNSEHNFYIKYTSDVGAVNKVTSEISNNGTNNGQVIFTPGYQTPERLYYVSEKDRLSVGLISIKNPLESTTIDVENEILGKKFYTSSDNVKFINGLKIKFAGTVTPAEYQDQEFIVEGVGESIKLIRFRDLDTPNLISDQYNTRFEGTLFEQFPFDDFTNVPFTPEYITINKASKDLNPWSRYNRWFHEDVITTSATANNLVPEYPLDYRAKRPIIEFIPDIQLYDFGNIASPNVDLIDNSIENVFFSVENTIGFYIDGKELEEGFRVIFNAALDPLVRGKIFKVNFVKIGKELRLDLIPDDDKIIDGSVVLIRSGTEHSGSSWYYDGNEWIKGQQRLELNQAPLFDLFDTDGNSFSGKYYTTNFKGNPIFGYGVGNGVNDPVLGFPLQYKNIGVEGTYLFKNYFATEEFLVVKNDSTEIVSTSQTYFKINGTTNLLSSVWVEAEEYHIPNTNGAYEVPLNLTNNPLNKPISEFTLTELTDHVKSMVTRNPDFVGTFPGSSNLKDLPGIGKFGSKLISNLNPLSFAHHFITDEENNLVNATRLVGEHYYQFKFNLIKTMSMVDQTGSSSEILDIALSLINQNKTTTFPYYFSDMVPYGIPAVEKTFKVTDSSFKKYALPSKVDFTKLSNESILIYLNGVQLLRSIEYTFDSYEANVEILVSLTRNDEITIKYYSDTRGSFIPPTPSKLGIYPKFVPSIYTDDTFAFGPTNVIQGHDGSITIAFNDYRDQILLEFEKRIFNNIKAEYRTELFDINSVLFGQYRNKEFTYKELINPIQQDFLKWKSSYDVDAENNLTFDIDSHKTYNYSFIVDDDGVNLPGGWREIFRQYLDTDRPHTHPWEMLGFSIQPSWWESEYGPAPYTSGNTVLWEDLELGLIKHGNRKGISKLYARPGLSKQLPVDENGNLVDVRFWGILGKNGSLEGVDALWKFGDCGPAETAWRRSSYWPFAVQILLAVAKPALYAALLFDTSRLVKNVVGHYVYSEDNLFLNQNKALIPYSTVDNNLILTSGYSVFVVEAGLIKNSNYVSQLQEELENSNFNLMNKVGGFVSKDKLEIVIDSVNPNSVSPGILLPVEDFNIHFNVSNPIRTVSLSGLIIQKYKGKFIVRGYDKITPYFTILAPIHQTNDRYIRVGGKSEDYQIWATNVFYSLGQVLLYQNTFYRAVSNHNSGKSFDIKNYHILSELPVVNGVTVEYASSYDAVPSYVSYGSSFTTIQEVADVIAGYGAWVESQGFIFDEFNTDLQHLLDWQFTIKEFIYWATQNWADNSVIALSPFANTIKFQFQDSVVDDVLGSFYDYSILTADGSAFQPVDLSISRTDGMCTITSKNDLQGIFFVRLRLVQKEHALIFSNTTRFNDVIYDVDTGYRQRRVRLIGFRTSNWNGDFFSPGFVYDSAKIQTWKSYQDYIAGDVVEYAGNYYSLDRNLPGKEKFEFTDWNKLGKKPTAQLIPNFEYKINQFEDFYSLDIDNFDVSQQQLAQHLTGYSSRIYLNNIFFNQIAQYKFFQGFIKEKGTKNALDKLARASVHNLQGKIEFNEEWAFRIGKFGAYSSLQEIEFPLVESKIVDNSQLIKFVDNAPSITYDSTAYVTPVDLTIKPYDYSPANTFPTKLEVNNLQPFSLPVAGYVRPDDVDYALKTKADLLNFVPGQTVKTGDTFWIGFDQGDWGVYRYARIKAAVTTAFEYVAGQKVGFETDVYHGLAVGDIIAITRLADSLNGIYVISEIPHLNQFVVESTQFVPELINQYGVLFKFLSSRFERFDDLADANFIADFKINKKIWIDKNNDGKWEVYQKINNYTPSILPNRIIQDSVSFGQRIVSKEESNLVVVSAPLYSDSNGTGRVFVYTNTDGTIKQLFNFGVNNLINQYYNNTTGQAAKLGIGLDYDAIDGIIVSGAPFASNIKTTTTGNTRYVNPANPASENFAEGLVILSTVNLTQSAEHRYITLSSQEPDSNLEFGSSVFIGNTASNKILLVSAPGKDSNTGAVYSYNVAYSKSFDGSVIEVNATATSQIKLPNDDISSGARFGTVIAGDQIGKKVAISAPGYDSGNGAVFVYSDLGTTSTYSLVQTLLWNDESLNEEIIAGSSFGYDVDMDDAGNWLFVSAFDAYDRVLEKGKVIVYKWSGSQFEFSQIISNPSATNGLKFGHSIETDASGNILTITSQGPNYFPGISFDLGTTSFDSESTTFGTRVEGSGSAYIYNRYEDKFIFSAELFNETVLPESLYGYTVSTNRNSIYVSAPNFISTGTIKSGAIHVWDAIDPLVNSWKLLRQQSELVDFSRFKQVKTIDTFRDVVQDYLEVFDPINGKIPQIADREIRYKTPFDPAIYNTGTDSTIVIDESTMWKSEHVGELWWDLSTLKYVWYEQGEVEFRKNSWGTLFPGCSIDVYEWVRAEYLPTVWASDADTFAGLAEGISGQPRYADNSAYVVEQVYSPVTNLYSNVYYFWVKNTVIVPNRQGRNLSCFDVAQLIEDPKSYDLKFIQPLSGNSLSIVNVKGSLINERILLNVQLDDIDNQNNRHTEWLLLEEGSSHSLPNSMLEKKMIDSLLGRDSLGNTVPDPTLSERQKYGIEVRPRQSMVKNRLDALRNVVDYTNYIFANNLITDFYNLTNLESKDEIPNINNREYDKQVEDLDQRNLIYYREFIQGKLTCYIENGKLSKVTIDEPGFGYGCLVPASYENEIAVTWKGPKVEFYNDSNGGQIETEVDSSGKIVSAIIVNTGSGYTEAPIVYVRPYTVLVTTDSDSKGRWAKYSLIDGAWAKVQTQSYDTTLYWDKVDWVSPEFNLYQRIAAIVEEKYNLSELDLLPGDYVKVNNNGAGRYIILRKILPGTVGTYDIEFDIMFSEKGTIKIKDSIWGYTSSQLGFDQIAPYDNTFFDQTPDIELEKIIYALRDDIFVGNLKVYWNKLFFAVVKYALTEQKSLDWAFKTSFISVHNLAGDLIQRPVYKFQDTQWYEAYLNEIKPYHTQIRNYQLTYDLVEPSNTFTTDFDFPVVFDKSLNSYQSLAMDDPLIKTYPYKGWYDNRTLYVESIVVDEPGTGYTGIPSVQIIAAPGETIIRHATAIAVISAGKVDSFEITDPGEGYTQNPTVVITGGGLTATDIPARATAQLNNRKVRANQVSLKFDRIARQKQIGSKNVTDTFIADGTQNSFVLSWPATSDKTEIVVKLDGIIVASSNFELEDYFTTTYGYQKRYTKMTLVSIPNKDSIVKIEYPKSLEIYTAYDRISDYYLDVPIDAPGANINEHYAQLMKGMEYPGTEIVTPDLNYDFSWDSKPFGEAKWDTSFQTADLDTVIDGGTLATTGTQVFSTAAGINPEDIILDGDGFISPWRSYAPEELVPGQIGESLAINVFTRKNSGSATIYKQYYSAKANTTSTIQISITPPSLGSITVSYDGSIFNYYDGSKRTIEFVETTAMQRREYKVDLSTRTITVAPEPKDGLIAITYMDVGGTGFICMNHQITEGSTTGAIFGDCLFSTVKSVYVTVDGARVYPPNSILNQTLYYLFTEENGKAKVTVYGLGTIGKHTITAAFFTAEYKGYSEVYDQIIVDMRAGQRIQTLIQPPGTLGPPSANSIVEVNHRRIVPPNTTYYEITNTAQTTFVISEREVYPPNFFDKTRLEIYKNGVEIEHKSYFLDDVNNQIIFPDDTFKLGDVLAITTLVDYDYIIRDNTIEITERVSLELPNFVRILTFNNQDASFIRTEVYKANSARLYKLSRKVLNDNFVWMSIGGRALLSGSDFEVQSDGISIQVDINVPYIEGEQAIITSFTEQTASRTTGFRIIKDNLGRTHFKRLSRQETTYLIEPLQLTDTTITVENGDVLPDADLKANVPGIILIAGERIEYMEKNGNVLSKIRRATFGTGAKDYYAIGTWVIDQGKFQTIPFTENVVVQTVSTSSTTISLSSSTFKFTSMTELHDQVEVYYGGKLLEKPLPEGNNRYLHDASTQYDPVNITVLQPDFTITGTVTSAILELGFTPSADNEVTVVQRRSSTWYNPINYSLFDSVSVPARFVNLKDTISPDQLYYGGDTVLRLDDQTPLTLDDGREIKGY